MKEESNKLANILLVEDSDDDIFLTKNIIEESNIEMNFFSVHNGIEALVFMNKQAPYENAPELDLVLLDLNMPEMSGVDVLAYMEDKNVPVVVCSGSSVESDMLEAEKLGAIGYIVKPLDYKKLKNIIEDISSLQIIDADSKHVICKRD